MTFSHNTTQQSNRNNNNDNYADGEEMHNMQASSSHLMLLTRPRESFGISDSALVSDIAMFVLKRDVKLQLTNSDSALSWIQSYHTDQYQCVWAKIAITGFMWTIAARQLVMEGSLSGRPTKCRYCRYTAIKGRCHGNHVCLSIYGVYVGATWRIWLHCPCAAAVRPYVKLLWPLVIIIIHHQHHNHETFVLHLLQTSVRTQVH